MLQIMTYISRVEKRSGLNASSILYKFNTNQQKAIDRVEIMWYSVTVWNGSNSTTKQSFHSHPMAIGLIGVYNFSFMLLYLYT